MFKQNTYRFGTVSRILAVLLGLVLVVTITIATTVYYAREASAAPSTYLNFQARLRTSTGSIVPDGNYNLEFKLYSQASGGSALWTETRTGGNVVRVANGYFSVSLGSVTAFPSNIDWGQEHWITMNIGGTGSPSWDGEMNPRLQLTAVPFAFQADRANTATSLTDGSNNFTSGDFVQTNPSSVQGINSANSAIRLNQTGAGGLMQLQSGGVDVLALSNTGDMVLGGTLNILGAEMIIGDGLLGAGFYGIMTTGTEWYIGSDTTDLGGVASEDSLSIWNGDTALFSISPTGSTLIRNSFDSTSAFQVMNSVGGSVLTVDTENEVVRIGLSDTTGTLLVLDTKTNAGDPTGMQGAMYYNSNTHKFRCYEGATGSGSWVDCIGAAGGDILQDGNSFGSDMTIGTNDSFSLNLETNGTTRMIIDTSGNIGVGTATPLEVGSSFNYTGGEQILHINSATDRARMVVQGANGAGIALFNAAGVADERFVALNNESGNTFFRVFDDSGVVARTPLVIQNATGNVGIGTTDPTNLLHVDGDQIVVTRGTSGSVELGATPSNQIGLIFRNTGRADVRRYPDRLSLLTTSGNGIPTSDNGINILNNGNVGIGTISPSVRLDIEGAAGSNAGLRVNAVTGYYGMQYFAENGVNKWHYEAAPTAHGGHFSIVESGVAERLRISPGGAVSLAGHSAPWGVAPTTGLRINMGTSSSATWLIGGYSGANFRGGIQLRDNGTAMRLYADGNFLEFGNNNLTVGGALSVGGNITSSGGGLIINGVTRIHNSGAIVGTTGTFSGNVSVNGTLNLGPSGQTFTAIRRTTITWDPPNTSNNGESVHQTTCLPAGSVVIGVVAPGNGPSGGARHYRWGSDWQGTVRFDANSTAPCPILSFLNNSGSAQNPASGVWSIWYIAP